MSAYDNANADGSKMVLSVRIRDPLVPFQVDMNYLPHERRLQPAQLVRQTNINLGIFDTLETIPTIDTLIWI